MTTVSVILVKTKADHVAAKSRLRTLMETGGHADEIAAQARLVQDYEQSHYPIPNPDPIDALLFRMEQEGLDRRGLCDLLGASTGRVSEVLAGRRPLSITMIRALHGKLGISGDILIKASRKRTTRPARSRAAATSGDRAI
jgi:HTH-type transcriptional regulator/antitoxin HigA